MAKIAVAPLVGAWIEIILRSKITFSPLSLPSWERGLKLEDIEQAVQRNGVAPLVGAWIEISV